MPTATLTRILLNPAHPTVRRDLADYPSLHHTLMSLFPDDLGPHPRAAAGVLHRIEPGHRHPVLLMQSLLPPDLHRLPRRYGTAAQRPLDPVLTALVPGRTVRYRITANPSRRSPGRTQDPPARCGRLHALHGDAALAWWARRAQAAGLDLVTTTSRPRPFCRSDRTQPGPHKHLVQFDGLARVSDPEALTRALLEGIGRAKTYGGGLLSLAPA
ncbi:type I-E CRISPR-associated protein Cas6/Cse3/CasE [Streptomyces violascens]|uniref:type I-E CRISPR-associated protein Cas6/Cse3/CasE n=1 Tax=Streptomyces violascens TaxID=67381 RepID=UPI0036BBFD0E